MLVQYCRSLDALPTYAKARDAIHLPTWQAFNRTVGTDGTVGSWHESYPARPGSYEDGYVNMPAFGLGNAGNLVEARLGMPSAAGRTSRS